jgi:hypothetical protein
MLESEDGERVELTAVSWDVDRVGGRFHCKLISGGSCVRRPVGMAYVAPGAIVCISGLVMEKVGELREVRRGSGACGIS